MAIFVATASPSESMLTKSQGGGSTKHLPSRRESSVTTGVTSSNPLNSSEDLKRTLDFTLADLQYEMRDYKSKKL